jgi:hypothetical protein
MTCEKLQLPRVTLNAGFFFATLLAGCSSTSQRADNLARDLGFTKSIVNGVGFRHVIYRGRSSDGGNRMHVYIEGDGVPFSDPYTTARDPTSAKPLMMRLMALDPVRSIELGRPCYFGLSRDGDCGPLYWTMKRYGPEVLDSMEAALRREAAREGATELELFGHSGGGSLAVLLAQRVTAVVRVVTIGPNLDTDRWCRLHHYTLLSGSLNPATAPADRLNLRIVHLVGERDTNTPAWLVEAAASMRAEPVHIFAGFDHECCWKSIWPHILAGDEAPGSRVL